MKFDDDLPAGTVSIMDSMFLEGTRIKVQSVNNSMTYEECRAASGPKDLAARLRDVGGLEVSWSSPADQIAFACSEWRRWYAWFFVDGGWAGWGLRHRDLSGRDLCGIDLTRMDLSGITLDESDLRGSRCDDIRVSSSFMRGTRMDACACRRADCFGLIAPGSTWCESEIEMSDFTRSNLSGALFRESSIYSCRFVDCNLRGTLFTDCDTSETDFSGSFRNETDPPIDGWVVVNGVMVRG